MTPAPPPSVASLPLGYRLVAGLGHATVTADLDFETYSEAGFVWDATMGKWGALPRASQGKKGLPVIGAARYAEHPSTEILCLAYDLHDGQGVDLWKPGDLPPVRLFRHIRDGGLLQAWNVGFERWIWLRVAGPRLGWPPVPEDQWRCVMARARAFSLPGSLDKAGEVLGAAVQKNPRGRYLLNRFSMPRNPTKADARLRIRPEGDPEGPELYEYCKNDVRSQSEIAALVPDLAA